MLGQLPTGSDRRPSAQGGSGRRLCSLAWRAHVWWGGVVDAVDLARRFGLGGAARLSDGPVARGKQGLVWRLDTAEGSWAVKVPFRQSDEDEVRTATAFQEAACAAGVPAPQVRRTTEGCVFATLGGRQVRVYEWVDLHAPDARLDPDRVGAVVAAIHRVSATDTARPGRDRTGKTPNWQFWSRGRNNPRAGARSIPGRSSTTRCSRARCDRSSPLRGAHFRRSARQFEPVGVTSVPHRKVVLPRRERVGWSPVSSPR